jgi:hypothetical protein
MREACSLVWSVLVLLFQSRASLGAEILIGKLDRKIMKLMRRDVQVPQFMTVPGVGEAVT